MKEKKERYETPHIVSYEVKKGAYSAASGVSKTSYYSLFYACCDEGPLYAEACYN